MYSQLSRRDFLKATALVLGSAAVAACGATPTATPAPKPTSAPAAVVPTATPAPKGPVKLRIAWWGSDARHKKYNTILDLYQSKFPNVTIEREFSDWAPYWEKLATQVASGNAPDLITNHQDLVAEYANRGALLALDPLIEARKIDLSDWPKGTIDSGKRGGKNWMVALGGTTASTIFNETWLKSLGVKMPFNTWNWNDYVEIVTAVQGKMADKQYASTDQGSWNTSFEVFVLQKGVPLYKGEKFNQVGYDKDTVAEFWGYWEKLRAAKALPPASLSAEYINATHADSMLVKKISPIHQMNANQLQIFQGYIQDELSCVPIPRGVKAGSPSGDWIGTAWQSIYSKTKLVDEAAAWTNWFINDIEPQKIFGAEHGLPGNKKIAAQIVPTLPKPVQKGIDLVSYLADGMMPAPDRPTQSADIQKAYTRLYNELAFGRMTLKQAVDSYFDEITRLLST